ncbi:MAG TPA: AraC family transcriptional regulator [Micrococcales bacterium]|uniref:AraC-like ligand-binding domain-containing protein n=1 Tax=Miniimonas arenae TaxID=676201 RepID=UPI000EE699F4|nr:helix-turn-helix domain-containing protein [Miniimonas arenae]HCX84883.1 AraC family transcriptional regulator [Micrococcales bacterium]
MISSTPSRTGVLAAPDDADPMLDAALDLSQFRAAVGRSVVPLDVRTPDPDGFRGAIDAETCGDIQVFAIRAREHVVHRTPALAAACPESHVKFTVVEHGSGMIVQDGRVTVVRAGDMVAYETRRPYSLLFDDATHMTVLMFPRSLLALPTEALSRVTATRLDGAAGIGSLVRPFVSQLGRGLVDAEARVARRLCRSAVDLVGALLEAEAPTAPSAQEDLVARIRDYVDEHLTEHDLDPARIARAHYVSVRHLHALFNEQGTTVSTLVRTRRLERCYDELTSPAASARSVGAIALAHGFVDAAHFSRAFRAHFGVSPSSVRG